MKSTSFSIRTALALAMLAAATVALADPPPPHHDPHANLHLDARFNHNHYYPARGYTVTALPAGHIVINHPSGAYYYHAGVWFRPQGPRWIVVSPPFGIIIPVLPLGFATVFWHGAPYYYADDVYYVRAANGYQVVEAPPANEVTYADAPSVAVAPPPSYAAPAPYVAPAPAQPRPSSPADGLFVYPKNGQTETQTAFDRIECVKWSINQTGFDPAAPSGDATARANFQRAASACLEARGYSVK